MGRTSDACPLLAGHHGLIENRRVAHPFRIDSANEEHLISGVVISGASAMHELIKAGAATLSF